MNLEERLERLEIAHRALAAQHFALQTTCRALLPLIDVPADVVERALASSSDASKTLMGAYGHDEEFQAEARYWMDLQAKQILRSRKEKTGAPFPALRPHDRPDVRHAAPQSLG